MKRKWSERFKKLSSWVLLVQMFFAFLPINVAYAGDWSVDNVRVWNFSNSTALALSGQIIDASDYPNGFDIRIDFSDSGQSAGCVQFLLDDQPAIQDEDEPFELFGVSGNFQPWLFPDGEHTLVVDLYTSKTCSGSPKASTGEIDFETYDFYTAPDMDNDGVPDASDNCPAVVNSTQTDGDGDGVGNACDNCLLVANSNQADTDVDGVGNTCDNCVSVANPKQENSNETPAGDACEVEEPKDIPTIPTIIFPTNGQYFTTTPILNDWIASEDEDGICQYQIEYVYDDGHTFVGAPFRYTDGNTTSRLHQPNITEQGGVTIRVKAMDCDNNWSGFSAPVHYYYDATPPTAPNVLGFENPSLSCGAITNEDFVTVQWSDSFDNLGIAGYQYEIDYPLPGGGRGLWSPFFSTPPYSSQYSGSLNEGTHYIKVRAKDLAGQYSPWSNICSITADWTAPDVMIETPSNGSLLSGLVQIKGSVVDDNPHHYWFVVTGAGGNVNLSPSQTGTINESESFSGRLLANWDTTHVPDGQYVIKLEARDAANNKDGGSVDWHYVTVDNSGPTSNIDFYLGTGSVANGFKVVFSENVKEAEAENPANYFLVNWPDYSASSGDLIGDASIVYDSNTRTATVTFVSPGWYVSPEQLWGVRDIHDVAGNLMQINPYSEYSTPLVGPVTGAFLDGVLGLNGDYVSSVGVSLVAVDPAVGSGVKQTYYSLDGLIFFLGNSFSLNTEGENSYCFYSVDWAGNVEETKCGVVSIDRTGPLMGYIDPTPENGALINNGDLEVRIDGEGASYCKLYLGGEMSYEMIEDEDGSFYYQFNDMPEGDYTFYVECFDEAGNEANITERTVTVDETPPVITLIGVSPVTVIVGSPYVDAGATALDNEDGDITAEIDRSSGDTVDSNTLGTYIIRYNVTDSAGNAATEVTRTVNVVSAPVVPITPVIAAPVVTTATTTPALATEETTEETPEVAGVTDTEDDVFEEADEAEVKGSSDKACPWWWVITLIAAVALAFVAGLTKGAKEDSLLKKFYYVWPILIGGAAWVAHYFLHNDFAATWFCDNYLLIALLLVVLGEAVSWRQSKKSEK